MIKKLFLLSLVLMLVFVSAACGSADEQIVGRWVFEEDPSWVTTFNEDGTGTHALSWGYGTTFRWSAQDNNIRWSYPDYPDMDTPYHITDGVLHITIADGTTFRYIRD